MALTKSKVKNRVVIEKATKSKLTRTRYIANGHDCWGNTESTSQDYVIINGESEDVYSSTYIIHNEEEVLETTSLSYLPDNIRIYLDKDLYESAQAKAKEERYKKYLNLKKEFDNDQVYIRDQKISKVIE
jgi:hypothetical protein